MNQEGRSFAEVLNRWIDEFSLTSQALAEETGLSKATVSRFRSGKREPAPGGETLRRLARGIAALAKSADAMPIYSSLADALAKEEPLDFRPIAENLNLLIEALHINVHDLSNYLNYDASYLSRIRSGQRKPADIPKFCNAVASFTARRFSESAETELVSLIGCKKEELSSPSAVHTAVLGWLSQKVERQDDAIERFLMKLSAFDLNEYIRTLSFASQDIQSQLVPKSAPSELSKKYQTLSGFMEAELDWLTTVSLSDVSEPILFYSDMPIETMSKDPEFPRKWLAGLALLLNKGVRLNMIHNIDRSFDEMLLGLEGWIPLYMTGLVSPYYLKNNQTPYFHHFLRIADCAALSGEAIVGFYEEGQYYLTRQKSELAYYKKRGERLLSRAAPLMKIYRQDSAPAYEKFLREAYGNAGSQRNILSSPPLYSLSEELLDRVLSHSGLEEEQCERIREAVRLEKEAFARQLSADFIVDELCIASEEEFAQYPVGISLADQFFDREVLYTYEEYLEHVRLTDEFAKVQSAYRCIRLERQPFRNIQIRIVPGKFAVISKSKAPVIHFVIRHPKLRDAIEKLAVPPAEDESDI